LPRQISSYRNSNLYKIIFDLAAYDTIYKK